MDCEGGPPSDELWGLIEQCWGPDPKDRINITEVRTHFTSIRDVEKVESPLEPPPIACGFLQTYREVFGIEISAVNNYLADAVCITPHFISRSC